MKQMKLNTYGTATITNFLESGSSPHAVPFGGRHVRFIRPVAHHEIMSATGLINLTCLPPKGTA